jgi:hypothetical protein
MVASGAPMPITSRAPQPGVPPAPVQGEPERHSATVAPVEAVPRSVGIVFVHGIGTQGPSDTFLDWSRPIVELLGAWRAGEDEPGDPVVRAAFDFSPTTTPLLELAIPAAAGLPPTSWLITEAWWAADLRAPSLATVTAYLGSRLATLVRGITNGYATRESMWDARRRLGGGDQPSRWRWIERLDRLQARAFSLGILVAPLSAAGSLVLAFYSLLRRIPIGPIRDFAEFRIIDSFLVDWFGDLPVLLDDPVQVANVRARVAGAIDRLRSADADAIVLVAHSGGAIVAFETLLDPAYADRRVDKLITLGQGVSLGWRLEADPGSPHGAPPPGDRLLGDLGAARPSLCWVDVWASYDPAPAGPIRPVPGVPLDVVDAPDADAVRAGLTVGLDERPPLVVESRPVTNRMSVLDDHGSYWDNDEGFLVPLVRHLDAARGAASASRFYRDPVGRADRIERRRERVAVLAAWNWLCALVATAALAILIVAALLGRSALAAAGTSLGGLVAIVPGHQLITGPLEAYGRLVGGLAAAAGLSGLADLLGSLGAPVLGALLVAGLFLVLARMGNGRWDAWDRRERAAQRPEIPAFPSRRAAAGEAIALIGGLVALAVATGGAPFGIGWSPVLALVAGSWLVGLAIRPTERA